LTPPDLVARVHAAYGDAWEAQGRLREAWGGAAADVRGLRLFASGLPHERWNSADAVSADPDLEAARRWFTERGVPWGVRVPEGMDWPYGRRLFSRALMALEPRDFLPAPPVAHLALSAANPEELDELAALDAAVYEDPVEQSRAWIEPHLHAPDVTTACARLGGELAGTGWALRTDGRAGPAVFTGGVAVAATARRRGIGAAVSSWLVQSGLGAGAELAVLAPDTDEAARIYGRLGFARVTAFVVHAAPH
jgi:GNAT superfamily N-acetyltransferase